MEINPTASQLRFVLRPIVIQEIQGRFQRWGSTLFLGSTGTKISTKAGPSSAMRSTSAIEGFQGTVKGKGLQPRASAQPAGLTVTVRIVDCAAGGCGAPDLRRAAGDGAEDARG